MSCHLALLVWSTIAFVRSFIKFYRPHGDTVIQQKYCSETGLLVISLLCCLLGIGQYSFAQSQIFITTDFQTLASSLFNLFITNDIYKQQLKLWTKKKEKVKESSWGDQVPKAGEVQGRANLFSVVRFLVRFVTSFRPGLKT